MCLVRGQSESQGVATSITGTASSHTLCLATTCSSESVPKYSRLLAHSRAGKNLDFGGEGQIFITTKKTKFINPFDPLKVHGELAAYHRRWVHAFPRDKYGLAFQAHHAIPLEEEEPEEEQDGEELSASESTFSPGRNASTSSFNAESYIYIDGKGSPVSEGQVFRGLSQGRRRSRFISGSSSVGEMVLPVSTGSGSVGSHDEQCSSNNLGGSYKADTTSSTHYQHPRSMHVQSAKWDDYGTGPESVSTSRKAVHPTRPVWYTRRRKSGLTERRMSDASGRLVEDFTSVQRTGVDWKSLTDPACLPVTVDFFPSDSKLDQDYYQSPSKLVVSSYDNEFDAATGSGYV